MRCPSCGTKCKNGSTHCPSCGVALDPKTTTFGGAACGVRATWGLPSQTETPLAPKRHLSRGSVFLIIALGLVLALLVALVLLQYFSKAPHERTLSTSNFSDASLRTMLADFDTDGNGALSAAEAAAVTELNCANMGLRSLAGIELFTNLEVLDASGNALGAVDLTGLGKLRSVDLSNNAITELNVADHENLEKLDVTDNAMTSLSVTGCGRLQDLACSGNKLARLDLAGCTMLTEFACDPDQNLTMPLIYLFFNDEALREGLAAFDTDGDGALSLREREAVAVIDLSGRALSDLDGLTSFPNLVELRIDGTSVTEIHQDDLPASLTKLSARSCGITGVDLSALTRLTSVDLGENPLKGIDLSQAAKLSNVVLDNCTLTGMLDLSASTRLATVDVTGNDKLTQVVVPVLPSAPVVSCDATCTVVSVS